MWEDANIAWQTGGSLMEDPVAASAWPWMRAKARDSLANKFRVLIASITLRVPVRFPKATTANVVLSMWLTYILEAKIHM